jgi:hypothetical protein
MLTKLSLAGKRYKYPYFRLKSIEFDLLEKLTKTF